LGSKRSACWRMCASRFLLGWHVVRMQPTTKCTAAGSMMCPSRRRRRCHHQCK
jgi:hypothetical protein